MEVGFGRGVGRKGNGMMRERMKTEEKNADEYDDAGI